MSCRQRGFGEQRNRQVLASEALGESCLAAAKTFMQPLGGGWARVGRDGGEPEKTLK